MGEMNRMLSILSQLQGVRAACYNGHNKEAHTMTLWEVLVNQDDVDDYRDRLLVTVQQEVLDEEK